LQRHLSTTLVALKQENLTLKSFLK